MLALNILRNGFLLQVDTQICILALMYINDVHDAFTFCGLQAVNESICLNDEGKYGVKTKAAV